MKPSALADTPSVGVAPGERIPRYGTFLLATVAVGLPLTSRGSLWGGAPGAMWPELVAVPVWLAAVAAGRRAWLRAGSGAWWAIALHLAAVLISMVVVVVGLHRIASPVFLANVAAAAGSWFGAWSTADPLYPVRSAAIYVAGPLFFLAARVAFRGRPLGEALDRMLLWGGAVAAALAVAQAASGRGLFVESTTGEPAVPRAAGPLPDPNAFASYLALVAAFGAVVWAERVASGRGGVRNAQLAAAIAWGMLIAVGLWVSGSRAAPLALVVLLAASMMGRAASTASIASRKRLVGAAVAILLALSALVAIASIGGYGAVPDQSRVHRFFSTFDVGQSAMRMLRGRPVLWQAGATMVLDEPIVGVGTGRYGVELGGRLPVGLWGVMTAENAHNYYLQAAAELGLVGAVTLLMILAVALAPLWSHRSETRPRAALYGAAAWCLTSIVGHPQLVPSLQLFFWGLLGAVTAAYALPRLDPGRTAVLIVLGLLAGRLAQEASTAAPGRALYAAGLHEREPTSPGAEIVRWTASRSRLDLRREGEVAELRFFVSHDRFPVTVRSVAGPWHEEHRFIDGGWKTLAYYLPGDARGRLSISLDTSPAFTTPEDARDLGVVLAPIRWRELGSEPTGAYPPETGIDGRRFRWASGVACFPLPDTAEVDVGLRADNPDLESEPLTVILTRAGAPDQSVSLGDRDWSSVTMPGGDGADDVICVQTSRTWNPRVETGSADARELGVAVSLPEMQISGANAGR